MRISKLRMVIVLAVVAMVVTPCVVVLAQEAEAPQGDELPSGMTAEDMAAWQKATAPGPEHEMLAGMAGNWTFEGTFWMAPGAPPMESKGAAERRMILGGRVLAEKVRSEFMGEVFEGFGMTGFDNVSGSYWGTWVDNMGTGLMVSSGECAEDGSCEFTGTYNDPMLGGPKTVRMTLKAEPDREVSEMFEQGAEGEFQSARMIYTRVQE
jgi:hypothetical protein